MTGGPTDGGPPDDLKLAIPEGWTREGAAICRRFRFDGFSQAWAFMSRVALLAEAADHHPDWRNVWNRVDIRLTTLDAQGGAGGLTEKDTGLARAINDLNSEAP